MNVFDFQGVEVYSWRPQRRHRDTPPVLLVHGGGLDARVWRRLAPAFASRLGREVYAPSWFNHGGSRALPIEQFVRRSILDVAEHELTILAERLCREHGTLDLVGHSMGALASMRYAEITPYVRRLVLLAPVVPAGYGGEPIEFEVVPYQPNTAGDFETQRRLFWPTIDADTAYELWLQSWPESPLAIWEATRWTGAVDPTRIAAPTLVIAADPKLDLLTPPREIIAMAERLDWQHHAINGAGHSEILFKEPQWREVATRCLEFLSGRP